jgi:NADH-quinone oxidoreductase subunit J
MIAILGTTAVCTCMLVCAIGVVRSPNLVHSVFWLAGVLVSTAAAFVALESPFLAGIQIVLYTGGVVTLMIFGVMLTQRDHETNIPNPSARELSSGAAALGILAIALAGIWGSPELAVMPGRDAGSAADVGKLFLGPHLLAFEVLSVLLLAAMIGAIVLSRRTDP